MKTREYLDQIDACFLEYEDLQRRHLALLKSENLPDVALMTIEREKVFCALKNSLNDFVQSAAGQTATDYLSELKQFEIRLNSIMQLDDKITNEIIKYKSELKTNLNRVRKGQVAMNGYKGTVKRSQRPHVLSMNR